MDATPSIRQTDESLAQTLIADAFSGLVVFLVALPLCLGIALASNAPAFSGLLAGIIGGLVVGAISGSHTSVSGPAAGLTAVIAAQIAALGSFEALLLAIFIAGVIQITLGVLRAGSIAAFVPSAVIKGLLAAIGLILILKQIPHLFGHDAAAEGEFSFRQMDNENTFTELLRIFGDFHVGAATIGLVCLVLLVVWNRSQLLQRTRIPAPLAVVLLGVGLSLLLARFGEMWLLDATHLVQVPFSEKETFAEQLSDFLGFLQLPDISAAANPQVYLAAVTIALVASLETLLNLEAVDKLDPKRRVSPANRELVAQGCGNLTAGLIGGLPVTSVIVRSSVNITTGGKTKMAALIHGVLLLGSVLLIPRWLNLIPLSCLAAVLIVTGFKLAKPSLFRQMWREGPNQFLPFVVTVLAIVLTDLLIGVLIGLGFSVLFILRSNLRRPLRQFQEKHIGGDVLRIELANQVSFLNRAALSKVLDGVPRAGHVLIDARQTDYIDADVQDLIWEYLDEIAPARGVEVSMLGLKKHYAPLGDRVQYVDYTTRELRNKLNPDNVLQLLREGNERFRTGRQLTRELNRQLDATADHQHPMAIVLSGASTRTPVELIFDVGLGVLYCARVFGSTVNQGVLASLEHACVVSGAKLILVMGHRNSSACRMAIEARLSGKSVAESTGCTNLDAAIAEIQESIDMDAVSAWSSMDSAAQESILDQLYCAHVSRMITKIRQDSPVLDACLRDERVKAMGAMYDVRTGEVKFYE
jgi:carbonic anhydrase